jgi:hypothetical protein
MFKHLSIFHFVFLFLLVISCFNMAQAKTVKKKKKSHHRSYKVSTHSRKSRHYKRGGGPDLKSITTNSPYTEDLNNGVNPVETEAPSL